MKQLKLAAALGVALAIAAGSTALAASPDKNRVWVKFKPGSSAKVESILRASGGKIHYKFAKLSAFAVSVPAQALPALRNNPNIEYIEIDHPRYPMAEVIPYGIPNVQAPQAVAAGADGTGIKVCVIDSGLKGDHEDFAGVVKSGFSDSTPWDTDTCGHGTHVAGTVAAVGGNSKGVVGVSPGKVSLHIIKVFDGPTCGYSYASSVVNAAQKCVDAGAKIINMSLGGGGFSTTEAAAWSNISKQGVLAIASAGNAGNATLSYPASYKDVMSVAAVDSANVKAGFSQFNSAVDISGPGVGTLSTYPFKSADVTVGATSYLVGAIEFTFQGIASAAMVSGGRCNTADIPPPGGWTGKVVLCERGDISFFTKVTNVSTNGGVAAIIYNNVPGGFSGTLGVGNTSIIPAVSMTQEDGLALVAGALGQTATVSTIYEPNANGYAYLSGTSMAAPHVSGVAALVWSAVPTATNQQVRTALISSALDLGAAGRDDEYGAGLAQALAATYLLSNGSTAPPPAPAPAPASLNASYNGTVGGLAQIALTWSSGAAAVDIYRDGSKIRSAFTNTGGYTDSFVARGRTFFYKVCNVGTSNQCSNTSTVSF